jgi:hypothetical protein
LVNRAVSCLRRNAQLILAQRARTGARCLCGLFIAVLASTPSILPASVIVVSNRTDAVLSLELTADGKLSQETLKPAETKALRATGPVTLRSKQLLTGYVLDPLGAYYIASDNEKRFVVGQIELPIRNDLKALVATRTPQGDGLKATATIPIKLFVDEEEPTRQHVWEKRLRSRIAAASEILKSHCFVELQVVAVGKWDSDDKTTEFEQSLAEFERETEAGEARLAIGFTSQFQLIRGRTHLGGIRGPLEHHLLLREWSQIITESERLEVLLHELGHFLGASHSPERNSVMRPVLGDRLARSKKFRIGFDPVNTLAMSLVGEQLASNRRDQFADLDQPVRLQLAQIYAELAKALPDDPAAKQFIAVVQRSRAMPVIEGARSVVAAIREAAAGNSRSATPLDGDALADSYLQSAASAVQQLPPPTRAQAFLIGIAVGLDRTDVLRNHAVAGALCRTVERDDERKTRLMVLGQPSLRGREDHLQHFVVSAALASMAGSSAAESVGLAKEKQDAESGTGFSFADYQADLAGIRFAESIQRGSISLDRLAQQFHGSDFIPTTKGLTEGLSWSEFTAQYGSLSDDRFQQQRASLLKRIQELPAYRGTAEEGVSTD